VEGIIIPARRRVHAYEGDYQLVPEPMLVSIEMGKIALECRSGHAAILTGALETAVAGRRGSGYRCSGLLILYW
jgi:hypothetical protein